MERAAKRRSSYWWISSKMSLQDQRGQCIEPPPVVLHDPENGVRRAYGQRRIPRAEAVDAVHGFEQIFITAVLSVSISSSLRLCSSCASGASSLGIT